MNVEVAERFHYLSLKREHRVSDFNQIVPTLDEYKL